MGKKPEANKPALRDGGVIVASHREDARAAGGPIVEVRSGAARGAWTIN